MINYFFGAQIIDLIGQSLEKWQTVIGTFYQTPIVSGGESPQEILEDGIGDTATFVWTFAAGFTAAAIGIAIFKIFK